VAGDALMSSFVAVPKFFVAWSEATEASADAFTVVAACAVAVHASMHVNRAAAVRG
jgi:hypothetical protein